MPLLKEETYTIDDIYALPDGERAELIDGHMYMMAPPSRKHQRISTRLVSIIDRYIEEHKGKCEVYAAPFAVYLDERSNTYVEPDISVICDPDKLDDRGCKGAPDWIIEIVSPASKKMDYLLKLLKYRFAGVKEDWIVDPADSEMQRQSLEDILLLSCRIDDVELVKALSLFRQKAHNVTSDSRTRTQLFDSMRELSDAYDAAMEVISEKLKDCVRGR